jgi:hypothetical protein
MAAGFRRQAEGSRSGPGDYGGVLKKRDAVPAPAGIHLVFERGVGGWEMDFRGRGNDAVGLAG